MLPKSVQLRAELMTEYEHIGLEIRAREMRQHVIIAKIDGLDFAIAEAKEAAPVAKARAERRNLAEMAIEFFTVGSIENATVDAIAKGIKCKPGETSAVLTRLSISGKVELVAGTSDRYRLKASTEDESAQAAE